MPRSDRAERLAYSKAYYRKNRERLLAEQKQRDQLRDEARPGERQQYQKDYRAQRREGLLEQQRARGKADYAANPDKYRMRRQSAKLRKYGLTPEQHAAILQRQEHQCPICERFLAYPTVASIDHSHATGTVRGVLCRRCNTALGLLEESMDNLERALEYLSMARLRDFTRWLSGVTSTTSSEPSSEDSTPPA
jgi:hypothetical protein